MVPIENRLSVAEAALTMNRVFKQEMHGTEWQVEINKMRCVRHLTWSWVDSALRAPPQGTENGFIKNVNLNKGKLKWEAMKKQNE